MALNLSITLVHNKTDVENEAQIEALLPLVVKVTTQQQQDTYNDQGEVIGQETVDIHHYELKGLNIPHQARFYQIVPFGVTPPPNLYALDSYKVFYGKGDEDKTGDHPRFFNWGLKRGTDHGAEISLYLEDASKFDVSKLITKLQRLEAKVDPTEFIEDASGKLATIKLLKQVGQLREDRPLAQAVTDLKTRVVERGLRNG